MSYDFSDSHITLFAKTNFRNKQVPFGIKREDRRRHMYVIGKTGMGKTNMIENMIIQDIVNGEGVCFIDPNGDAVEKILDYIPPKRINDVVYFNPADLDFPIAFNILESVDPKYKHLVASGLMSVFTKIWANLWSARMEYILNNAILALLDSPGNTLLGISRILVDKKYRKRIVDNIKDPMVKSFWVDEFANWNEKYRMEAIAPIQNKVGQFLSSGIIRNIVGQPKSTIDLRDLMDNRKILLVNLAKGRVGEDNSALLGAMIITKLQLAAFSRADVPEEQRSDFFLYVDEFQNFATESFATILSEARKYRLNLIIAHQYIGQLIQEKNTKVRDAVFGNVGTMVTFRVGAADAEYLEKEFMPTFVQNDLVNLPKYTVVLRLMINGVASDPFTAETLAPSTYVRTESTEKTVRVSRERYANPVADVEDKILRWMGQDYHEQAAVIASHAHFEGAEDEGRMNVDISLTDVKEAVQEGPGVSESGMNVTSGELNTDIPGSGNGYANNNAEEKKVEQPKAMAASMVLQQEPVKHEHGKAEQKRPQNNNDRRKEERRQEKKPNKPKRDNNPIWNQVANLSEQKISKSAQNHDLVKSLEQIDFNKPVVKKQEEKPEPVEEIPTDLVPVKEDVLKRAVLRPGESVRINEE